MKFQRELLKCIQAISNKYNVSSEQDIGKYLFTVIVTLVSLRDVENNMSIDIALLDDLCKTLNLNSRYELWNKYVGYLLNNINKDPKSWMVVTAERCIFETVLLESGEAFGENLETIAEILIKTLDTEADAEARLKTFIALSTAFENKDTIFKNASNINTFLEVLISGKFLLI